MRRVCVVALLICLSTVADARTPRGRTPLPTRAPTPTLQPESFAAICRATEYVRNNAALTDDYYDVLACLGWTEPPIHLIDVLRTAYLPTKECIQDTPVTLCCDNYYNNFCGWTCDGVFICPVTGLPARVRGSVVDCETIGPVIAVPTTCSTGHSAWRHELIHLLRREMGDESWAENDEFWGWRCQ